MTAKFKELVDIVRADPAVATVVGTLGGGQSSSAMSVNVAPAARRYKLFA